MTTYRVTLSLSVQQTISDYQDYVAVRSGSLSTADDWSDSIIARLQSLETVPDRFPVATEYGSLTYEARQMILGRYIATYTILPDVGEVRVIGFRHAAKLPRVGDLPDDPAG
ncbi:MAG: hypothetical protein AAF266_12080 [Planctomycetota bacterium]